MERFASARARDPFTQEVIRPCGIAFQASAFLDDTGRGQVDLLLFRGPGTGGFDRGDLRAFGAALPYFRAAAMQSRGALQLDADRRAAAFEGRGDPVVRLAHDGSVQERSVDVVGALAPYVGLSMGRLVLGLSGEQRRLDRAVAAALDDGKPGLVTIAGAGSASPRLLVLSVAGQALDVFRTTAALVVVLDLARPARIDEGGLDLLADAAALTKRERDVVRLVAGGIDEAAPA